MKKEIFLPQELIASLRLLAVHDGFPQVTKIFHNQDDATIVLDEPQAKVLVRFARYLQVKAELRALNDNHKIDVQEYERLTQGLPDKLLAYLLSEFPECA